MPNFAANLSMMFTEVPFLDRFKAAAEVGFRAVEFLFPYQHAASEIATRLQENKLTQALFNLPPGDWEKGERGQGILPGREQAFADSLELAISYAKALNCEQVHCMAGIAPQGEWLSRAVHCQCALVNFDVSRPITKTYRSREPWQQKAFLSLISMTSCRSQSTTQNL